MIQVRKTFLVCVGLCAFAGSVFAQEPAQAEPPAAQNQPAAQVPAQQPAPATKPPAANEVDEYGYTTQPSLLFYYWMGPMKPSMRTGTQATAGQISDIDYPGKRVRQSPGVVISLPAGKENALRFSWFRTMGSGNTTASQDLVLFGTSYTAGDYMAVAYTLQNFKASFDYLSWPFPVKSKTFRLRTLWEVQYTTIRSAFDAPFKLDSSGNLTFAGVKKSNSFIYPSFGIGVEKFLSKNVRWEAKGSGFAWPGKSQIWDADTDLALKAGPIEFLVGAKGFHFRTTKNNVEYVRGTQYGGFAGIRWYPKF